MSGLVPHQRQTTTTLKLVRLKFGGPGRCLRQSPSPAQRPANGLRVVLFAVAVAEGPTHMSKPRYRREDVETRLTLCLPSVARPFFATVRCFFATFGSTISTFIHTPTTAGTTVCGHGGLCTGPVAGGDASGLRNLPRNPDPDRPLRLGPVRCCASEVQTRSLKQIRPAG